MFFKNVVLVLLLCVVVGWAQTSELNVIVKDGENLGVSYPDLKNLTFTKNETGALIINPFDGPQQKIALNRIDKIVLGSSTDIKKLELDAIPVFDLRQNYPNPFNPTTTIEFSISESALTEISIMNVQGQVVQTLMRENLQPGTYAVVWDGKNSRGQLISSGVYFYKVVSGDAAQVKKCVFIQ